MSSDMREAMQDVKRAMGALSKHVPEEMKGFSEFMGTVLKPGKLDAEEFAVMKQHAEKGREIIDTMLAEFGLDSLDQVDVLRNIATHHHESLNGSGYPEGLSDGNIPLEARIVAVADVFDALTSRRPYKEAWDNQRAFEA